MRITDRTTDIGQPGSGTAFGLLAGTRVCTQYGLLPVQLLAPGDRIVTRSGARRLVSMSVQLRRNADLIRVRASTLGPDRPEADLLVAPGQCLLISDWRARVLYKQDQAAIPALRLVDDEFILCERHPMARMVTLRFAEDEVILAEGLQVACPAQVGLVQPQTVSA
jgi:hypothetical protein